MSFWKFWTWLNSDADINWGEAVKGGVEASDKIFALAEAVNKQDNKAFLTSVSPYLEQTASLLDVLNSPLGEVVKSSIPFVGIATGLLGFIIEKTKEDLSIESCIFLVVQRAVIKSMKIMIMLENLKEKL